MLAAPINQTTKDLVKRLRILQVAFDNEIQPYQLSAFRGAVARKVGIEHEWFHNHDNEHGGFHNRYPLIQYKLDTYKGQMRPMLLCLEEGIEEAHHLFSQPEWNLTLKGEKYDLRIGKLNVNQYTLNVWEQSFHYRLHKWQVFNTDRYNHWKQLDGIAEQYAFMEEKLAIQIASFGKGVGWQPEQPIAVKITSPFKAEWLDYKQTKVQVFSLDFKVNVSLPDFIGLGKGASRGLGVVRRVRDRIDKQ
jgi:hypothetical protein